MVQPTHPVHRKLTKVAAARQTITYVAVATLADLALDNPDDVTILGMILDSISEHEVAENRPLLPIVVVDESGLPWEGVLRYAKRKGLAKAETDAEFVAAELAAVYACWAGDTPC